jgi:hypothetical protein
MRENKVEVTEDGTLQITAMFDGASVTTFISPKALKDLYNESRENAFNYNQKKIAAIGNGQNTTKVTKPTNITPIRKD